MIDYFDLGAGFATHAEWLWEEERDGPTAQQQFDGVYATPADDDLWTTVVSDPGPTGLFADAVHDRGAATLHVLRPRSATTRSSSCSTAGPRRTPTAP